MELLTQPLMAASFLGAAESLVNVLVAAIGLGLVIFFHELGHFAVAKWCDVNVERFSIGFGPILWRKKWGETEYALSAIPFGGYVKMLGQDDIDPSQLSSEEIAEDPRSYTAKSVPQRMAIISAGVTMNVITGLLFFATAFSLGVIAPPAIIGDVRVGMPAWEAGIRKGDEVLAINGDEVVDFSDIMRGTALTAGPIQMKVRHPGEEPFTVTVVPNETGPRRQIGVSPSASLKTSAIPEVPAAAPGSAADRAEPALQSGDKIVSVDGQPIGSHHEFEQYLAEQRNQPVEVTVQPTSQDKETAEPRTLRIPPQQFRRLGIRPDMGKVAAIRQDSPADEAGIEVGDKLISVDGQDVGQDLDPLHLPDYFANRAGETVSLVMSREVKNSDPEQFTVTVRPEDRGGWTEPPIHENSPLSIPALGLAYDLIPVVLAVEEGSPAAQARLKEGDGTAAIRPGDSLVEMELFLPPGSPDDNAGTDPLSFKIGDRNWAYAFWKMQQAPQRHVRLRIASGAQGDPRTVELEPVTAEDWYLPTDRGLRFYPLAETRQADDIGEALQMGVTYTSNSMQDIYLTLRNLLTGRLSVKELHGPLGIAKLAHDVAAVGLSQFLLFLGLLSINLAVLNFLPIPVLDGGHMVFLAWEGIARRKPSEKVVIAATWVGMCFVLCLMLLVIALDISRFTS